MSYELTMVCRETCSNCKTFKNKVLPSKSVTNLGVGTTIPVKEVDVEKDARAFRALAKQCKGLPQRYMLPLIVIKDTGVVEAWITGKGMTTPARFVSWLKKNSNCCTG